MAINNELQENRLVLLNFINCTFRNLPMLWTHRQIMQERRKNAAPKNTIPIMEKNL